MVDLNKKKLPGIAVKALVVRKNKVLLIKRREDDVHKGGCWDLPGGRLDPGESPITGLLREVEEETGLVVQVKDPLSVHHFTRDDGQVITMITFWCLSEEGEICLSEEHTEWLWLAPEEAAETIDQTMRQDIDSYIRWFAD